MVKRLLVDATHPEETRVVVIDGTHMNAFDVESSARKQFKGNIYLAKVMRVEPSLQAAFVDFGGNRHGFLAFGDIHPDYYQIPVEDRAALQREQAAEEAALGRAEEEALARPKDAPDPEQGGDDDVDGDAVRSGDAASGDEPAKDSGEDSGQDSVEDAGKEDGEGSEDGNGADGPDDDPNGEDEPAPAESVGGDDIDSAPPRRTSSRRYKIQEVIKRRQVLLVQVVKEERGSKGAALTTYLSLAGRYCVLMPNTARGGGVSRKISAAADRKKLRTIIESLSVPDGMGLIVRTAGQSRTKTDIRNDYQYLMRLWESVRGLTLKSTAPTLVYEDANLIKRAIRDLYSNDIPEVLVEGEVAYKAAKAVMKMLVPSHAKRVKQYTERVPLFRRHQVEEQLDKMHMPQVTLKSGGSIVINPTEALVAIDVNSGRATRERSIEATALKTNLEASEEIAKQLSLRDLAGLIVIDYIDMDQSRNNRAVERRLKDALKMDRARIQVGRISTFGLMELSRQRMGPSLLETTTDTCPTCAGIGLVRSTESAALHALRAIEDEGVRGPAAVTAALPMKVATYLLNKKRLALTDLEIRFGLVLTIVPDADLVTPHLRIERQDLDGAEAPAEKPKPAAGRRKAARAKPEVAAAPAQAGGPPEADASEGDDTTKPSASKRRRRGKRGGRRRRRKEEPSEIEAVTVDANDGAAPEAAEAATFGEAPPESTPAKIADPAAESEVVPADDSTAKKKAPAKRKRAPRKTTGRTRKPRANATKSAKPEEEAEVASSKAAADSSSDKSPAEEPVKPKRRRPRRRKADAPKEMAGEAPNEDKASGAPKEEKAPAKVKQPGGGAKEPKPAIAVEDADDVARHTANIESAEASTSRQLAAAGAAAAPLADEKAEEKKPAKKGWWRSKI